MKSMVEAINRRVSVRSYADRPLEQDKKKQIIDLLQSTNEGPLGNEVKFNLIDFSELEKKEIRSLGTTGSLVARRSLS